jgi:hypothetical protein
MAQIIEDGLGFPRALQAHPEWLVVDEDKMK